MRTQPGFAALTTNSGHHAHHVFFSFIASHIAVCPHGSFYNSNNGDACELCPENTYNSDTNADFCTDCPAGTHTQGRTGQESVTACGTFSGAICQEKRGQLLFLCLSGGLFWLWQNFPDQRTAGKFSGFGNVTRSKTNVCRRFRPIFHCSVLSVSPEIILEA